MPALTVSDINDSTLDKRYRPMEAQPASELPFGLSWQYKPKWDGFRCLAFRAADANPSGRLSHSEAVQAIASSAFLTY